MPELKKVLFQEQGKLIARPFVNPELAKSKKLFQKRHRLGAQFCYNDLSPVESLDETVAVPLDRMAQIIAAENNSPRLRVFRTKPDEIPSSIELFLFRYELGLTQIELGKLAGISGAQISEYELQKSVPDPTEARRIANVLCKEVEEVFPDKEVSLEVPMS